MNIATRRTRKLGLAGAVLLAACWSRPQLATTAPTLLIRVEGRAELPVPLMLWAERADGERLRLGLLGSASSNLVRFDRVDTAAAYRFVAEPRGGRPVTSPSFTPGDVRVVAWDLGRNTLTPVETGPR